MIPGLVPSEETYSSSKMKPKYMGVLAAVILVGGIILAWLGGQGVLPFDPGITLTITILTITVIMCCGATIMMGSVLARIPEYQDMELRFNEGIAYFENGEWENALLVFTEQAGPKMDHIRADYYSALCYAKLDDWENVKKYIKAYLKLKPNDKEAWEILADAHKKLFEYDDADFALEKAAALSSE